MSSLLLPPPLGVPRYGEITSLFSPLDLLPTWGFQASNIVPVGGKVGPITDESGAGHHINQTTDARRPAYTLDATTGLYCVEFSTNQALDQYLPFTTPWTQSVIYDCYGVFRYRTISDYQNYLYGSGAGGGQTSLYLGFTTGNFNKPVAYGGANMAVWSSALTDNQLAIIRWTVNMNMDLSYVNVGNGTRVTSPGGVNYVPGSWQAISTGAVAVQECVSRIFETWMYDYELSAAQNTQLYSHLATKYGV